MGLFWQYVFATAVILVQEVCNWLQRRNTGSCPRAMSEKLEKGLYGVTGSGHRLLCTQGIISFNHFELVLKHCVSFPFVFPPSIKKIDKEIWTVDHITVLEL